MMMIRSGFEPTVLDTVTMLPPEIRYYDWTEHDVILLDEIYKMARRPLVAREMNMNITGQHLADAVPLAFLRPALRVDCSVYRFDAGFFHILSDGMLE